MNPYTHSVSRVVAVFTLSACFVLPACGGDDGGSDDGTGGTAPSGGTSAVGGGAVVGGKGGAGGASSDKGGSSARGGGASVGGAGSFGTAGAGGASTTPGSLDEFGFERRGPSQHTLTCKGAYDNTVAISDTDWIRTFEDAQGKGVAYFQSTPVSCRQVLSAVATFQTSGWLSRNGVVTPLASAAYDWGGNHHNDAIDFEVGGLKYRYYHSSFGWGWRACQNMDCARIYASDGTTVQTDGCTHERTLPIVCSSVESDGKIQPLEDHFATCLGDSNE
ncbi:MAG: hypothetical protein QM784_34970 [Polyangiaceae bacterium]